MYLKKCLARFVGLTVADVVSAVQKLVLAKAGIRFAPERVNRFHHSQLKEVIMYMIKKLVASLVGLNPAGSCSAAKMQSLLLTFILMVAALWVSPAAIAAEKEMVREPSTGKMVTAPEYGGTITFARTTTGEHPDAWYIGGFAYHYITLVNEKLGIGDWGIDRDVFDWRTSAQPLSFFKGHLAESWETPDPTTIIFHIRQGVHWHDKAPMNGRALTAQDIEFNYHRLLGIGSGFSEASPHARYALTKMASVTATDQGTVVFKLKEIDLNGLAKIIDGWISCIYPPEVIKQHGDYKDWRNVVGTGPYELTDVTEGSSITWTRNPEYWGTDEKYPQNRLPYADQIKTLILPDPATRLATLRSGRIDLLGSAGDTQLRSLDQIENLRKTNPEFELWPFKSRNDNSFTYNNVNNPPFNDIRVRQAMQMALDRETIANTYFRGFADPTPQGMIASEVKGIGTPFDEWPEALKKTNRYDPEGAKKLLAEAGYPDGFKATLDYLDRFDASYAELIAAYWRAIGVEVRIEIVDVARHVSLTKNNSSDGIVMGSTAQRVNAMGALNWFALTENPTAQNDPKFIALVEAASAATTLEEQERILKEAVMYHAEQHWQVEGPEAPQFNATQPWVKGYNGEINLGNGNHAVLARLWIDQDLKKEMGY